jgi:hypothetical protein
VSPPLLQPAVAVAAVLGVVAAEREAVAVAISCLPEGGSNADKLGFWVLLLIGVSLVVTICPLVSGEGVNALLLSAAVAAAAAGLLVVGVDV